MAITTEQAVKKLQKELKDDLEFRDLYHSTMSMSVFDILKPYQGKALTAKDIIKISNGSAEKYLDLFIS